MAKFISFETRKFANGNGWRLLDISVNIDNISIVRKSDIVHTFSKYDMDTGTTKTFDYPCTVLVTYDGIELTVLGSYEDTLSKINRSNKIMKINTNSMKKVYKELLNTFCKKNHDYGSSFEQSLDKHGLVAGVVRMEDKMNRLSTLVDSDTDAKIASESLVDTLMDLSNYAAMSACWLMGQDEKTCDEEPTESGNFTGLKVLGDDIAEVFSGSIATTMGKDEFEGFKKALHLSSFGHQEKVNEQAYYEKDGVSDEEIIKNWALVGDSTTLRSRTTGYYLVEDDNPELSRKILLVLQKHRRFNKFESHIESLSKASWKPAPEDIVNEAKQFSIKLKGLENGYFIRQHINSDNSYRYTIAFNPEGTIETQDGEDKPYLLECFGNDGMNVWAIHVFDTQEDMVAALNYDLTVRDKFKSKNFGDSIKGSDIKTYVYTQLDAPQVFDAWVEAFGLAFDNYMKCKNLAELLHVNVNDFSDEHHIPQGVKIFGIVFISEKTGALVIKGVISEQFSDRNHNFIWFSDTKEVLLEVKNTVPKFNCHGIIYGIISKHIINGDPVIEFNTLYQSMEDKIISKFNNWDASELKNIVFFNEDEGEDIGPLVSDLKSVINSVYGMKLSTTQKYR